MPRLGMRYAVLERQTLQRGEVDVCRVSRLKRLEATSSQSVGGINRRHVGVQIPECSLQAGLPHRLPRGSCGEVSPNNEDATTQSSQGPAAPSERLLNNAGAQNSRPAQRLVFGLASDRAGNAGARVAPCLPMHDALTSMDCTFSRWRAFPYISCQAFWHRVIGLSWLAAPSSLPRSHACCSFLASGAFGFFAAGISDGPKR